MIDIRTATEFLSHKRIAVAGASADPKKFGNTIYRELKARAYEVTPVNPSIEEIEGARCYPDIAAVPGELDGVIVMVPHERAAEVVQQCIARGIPRVWLFQGLGGPGSAPEEAIALCRDNGIAVVAGACPMMFLEPVGFFHGAHRAIRRLKGALGVPAAAAM